jgi:hypothetical protein
LFVDFTRNPFESNWYKSFGIYDQSIYKYPISLFAYISVLWVRILLLLERSNAFKIQIESQIKTPS